MCPARLRLAHGAYPLAGRLAVLCSPCTQPGLFAHINALLQRPHLEGRAALLDAVVAYIPRIVPLDPAQACMRESEETEEG